MGERCLCFFLIIFISTWAFLHEVGSQLVKWENESADITAALQCYLSDYIESVKPLLDRPGVQIYLPSELVNELRERRVLVSTLISLGEEHGVTILYTPSGRFRLLERYDIAPEFHVYFSLREDAT